MELAAERKSLSRPTLRSNFPGKGSIAVQCRRPPPGRCPPGPAPGFVVVQASRRAVRIQRTKTMASRQNSKQAKSATNVGTGKANKPARNRQRARPAARFRRHCQGPRWPRPVRQLRRQRCLPKELRESVEPSKNITLSPEHQAAQSTPIAEDADLAAPICPALTTRASTKRAAMIGMLERPRAVGRRDRAAAWLAAAHGRRRHTGLRHAGRSGKQGRDGPIGVPARSGRNCSDRLTAVPPDTMMPAGRRYRASQARHLRASRGVVRLYKAMLPHISAASC